MAFKCFFIFFLAGSTCIAQFKNVKLEDISSPGQKSEPSIAINKKNPNNLVGASTSENFYYTHDGGGTWQKVKSTLGAFTSPVLISDDKGTIYCFGQSVQSGEGAKGGAREILCHISDDGGKNWEAGAAIRTDSKDQYKPGVTIDTKDNLWVAWTQFDALGSDDENCQSNIYLSTSSNGKKWSKPFQISQNSGNCKDDDNSAEGAMPAVAADGKAFVSWSNQNRIFLDRSFSGGGLWLTNDIAITEQPGGWNMKIPGYEACNGMPDLAINQSKTVAQGTLFMVWADQRNGENDTDIWFMRSTNFGDNWTSPMKLGEDKNKRHQYAPSMTVDQSTGFIYVVFFDRSDHEGNETDVFLAYSADLGSSFKTAKISETSFNPENPDLKGAYTGISAHKGVIVPVWTRVDGALVSTWTSVIKQADLMPPAQPTSKKKK